MIGAVSEEQNSNKNGAETRGSITDIGTMTTTGHVHQLEVGNGSCFHHYTILVGREGLMRGSTNVLHATLSQ